MASLLQQANTLGGNKRKAGEERSREDDAAAPPRRNKQRVLMLPSRGVTSQMRHLVTDLEALMPQCKKGERRNVEEKILRCEIDVLTALRAY